MAQRTKTVLAAQAFERIKRLEQERTAELAGAPDNINARFDKRAEAIKLKLDPEVLEYLERLLREPA